MKRIVLLFTLLMCILPLSGCAILFEEPSELILPPASDKEEYYERTIINSFLSEGAHLQVPEDMEDPASFINLDIDGDDQDEKLAFWSNNDGHEVGVMLMARAADGNWSILDQIRQYGNSIEFFRYLDIDGDGKKEACVGVNVGADNVLTIYRLDEEGFTEMTQIDYSFLEMVDIDGHKNIYCVLNDYDNTTPSATLTVYECGENVESVYEKSFAGNCLEIAYGNVSDDTEGLYLVHSNNYSDLDVELLLPSEEGLQEQVTASVYSTNRSGASNSIIKDIDGDGVLNVQSVLEPIEITGHEASDYLRVWKSWDGENGLKNVYGVLENSDDGYSFTLPQYWLDSVRYQFVNDGDTSQVRFYDGNRGDPALIIYSAKTVDVENSAWMISLGRSQDSRRVYYALLNTDVFAGQLIDRDSIAQLFQIEGGQ